jgi:uncharacterized membrane protein YfcA
MTALAAVLGLAVGLVFGLLGAGGSILTVPIMVFALGQDPKVAIVMSLPIVGGVALVGVTRHWRAGNVDLRTAIPFGIAAMVGAFGGARLARFLEGGTQLTLLALLMFGAAISMFRNASLPDAPAAIDGDRKLGPMVLALGAFTGVLTGLVGIGGGFLLVPALVLLAKVPMHSAVGTSLVVITMNTVAGYLGYLGSVDVPWRIVAMFGGIAAVGVVIGIALLPRFPQATLKRAFAVLLVAVATFILYRS